MTGRLPFPEIRVVASQFSLVAVFPTPTGSFFRRSVIFPFFPSGVFALSFFQRDRDQLTPATPPPLTAASLRGFLSPPIIFRETRLYRVFFFWKVPIRFGLFLNPDFGRSRFPPPSLWPIWIRNFSLIAQWPQGFVCLHFLLLSIFPFFPEFP